jgi:hypothetical protein
VRSTARVDEKHRPGFGEFHPARGSAEQLHAEFALEALYAAGQRRLRHVQSDRGPVEVEFFSHGDEALELAGVKHRCSDCYRFCQAWSQRL